MNGLTFHVLFTIKRKQALEIPIAVADVDQVSLMNLLQKRFRKSQNFNFAFEDLKIT